MTEAADSGSNQPHSVFTWTSSWFHHLGPALRDPGETHTSECLSDLHEEGDTHPLPASNRQIIKKLITYQPKYWVYHTASAVDLSDWLQSRIRYFAVIANSSHPTVEAPLHSWEMDTLVIYLSSLTLLSLSLIVTIIRSHQINCSVTGLHLHLVTPPPHPVTLRCLPLECAGPRPWLTEVGACELSQDAEGAGLGGASAGLPVLGVLDQPLLAAVVGDKTGQVLHPEAVPAHTPSSSTRQARLTQPHLGTTHSHQPS